jgi:hypothetical protein
LGGASVVHPHGVVCQSWVSIKLKTCNFANYMCTVISLNGSVNNPPDQDIFIEWYWKMNSTELVGGALLTGKMTFVASVAYLLAQWSASGDNYNGPSIAGATGLPLLNCTNHSQ